MSSCTVVRMEGLMRRTEGVPDIAVGLIDGPVATGHPDLAAHNIRNIDGGSETCRCPDAHPCLHGTFVAGILHAERSSAAPAICPGCTLLVRPVFADCISTDGGASPDEMAAAIHDCIDAGAVILNLSSALLGPQMTRQPRLTGALNRAAQSGILVVTAAGNAPTVAATVITGHPWVVPVAGYDHSGRPARRSTTGQSIGRNGIGAPSEGIVSITPGGGTASLDGTSFATPFVTGTAALLWSLFPDASAVDIRHALLGARRRTSIIPPLLDAEHAYRTLESRKDIVRQAI